VLFPRLPLPFLGCCGFIGSSSPKRNRVVRDKVVVNANGLEKDVQTAMPLYLRKHTRMAKPRVSEEAVEAAEDIFQRFLDFVMTWQYKSFVESFRGENVHGPIQSMAAIVNSAAIFGSIVPRARANILPIVDSHLGTSLR
jgi:hypothetical protein